MSWVEVAFQLKGSEVDHGTALLESLEACAISLLDAKDTPIFEPPPNADPIHWDDSILVGLFEQNCDLKTIQKAIETAYPDAQVGVKSLEEQNWVALCQAQFPVQQFGRLWVCPSWETPPEDPEAVCLHLDPGMAFGTGTHPTTHLCLSWLAKTDLNEKTIIDYGCGSGILALGAKLLGAKEVIGIDYDPQALTSASANRDKNGLDSNHVRFYTPDESPQKVADVIIANILAHPLKTLKNTFYEQLTDKGILVLSGILQTQNAMMIEHYEEAFELLDVQTQEDWSCLVLQKRPISP